MPGLFAGGSYAALATEGSDADRVCAFARERDGVRIVVAALLFPARGEVAADTLVELPGEIGPRTYDSILDWRRIEAAEGGIGARDLFATLPVAVLSSGG